MRAQRVLSIGGAALAAIAAAAVYVYVTAAPACTNRQTLGSVSGILRDEFHLGSIFLNAPRSLSGGFFSGRRDCWAEVAAIRGNENASTLPWREVRYRIVHEANFQPPAITVELGGAVPLAPPAPSLWARLLAYL